MFDDLATYRSNIFQKPYVASEFWTTMLVDGAETTLPGCLLLEFGADGRCRSLRGYWHFEGGLLEPPPE